MFKRITALFLPTEQKRQQKQQEEQAFRLYNLLITQCRQDWFFDMQLVKDDFSGRFDLLSLHAHMLFARLKASEDNLASFSQTLFDFMFAQFDLALREDGVGDMSIGKHIKKMAQGFYGRAKAYDLLLSMNAHGEKRDEQIEILRRNLNCPDASEGSLGIMLDYCLAFYHALEKIEDAQLLEGTWPALLVTDFQNSQS